MCSGSTTNAMTFEQRLVLNIALGHIRSAQGLLSELSEKDNKLQSKVYFVQCDIGHAVRGIQQITSEEIEP